MFHGSLLKKPTGAGDDNAGDRKRKNLQLSDDYFEADDDGEIKVLMTITGKIISFKVKGSDTISNMKVKIRSKEQIPFDEQELMFNQKVLDNKNTLADLRIKKQSTLRLLCKSVELMEIFVNTFTGKTISLSVKPTYIIADVKWEITYREHIPVDEQVLIFNEMVLGDFGTLFDLNINRKSTLTLMRKSKGFMKIFIKTPTEETVALAVKPSCAIADIKTIIQDKLNIPYDDQELIFNHMILDNMRTLADFHIRNESTLILTRRSNEFMIFIKTFKKETITLEVKSSDTISNIKSKIQDKIQSPHDEHELIFNERVLDDKSTLADFYINKNSTLKLMCISTGYMNIFINILNKKTITLKVKPSCTIYDMKSKIYDMVRIPPAQQRLVFSLQPLEDSATVADYHIRKASTINLMIVVKGGC